MEVEVVEVGGDMMRGISVKQPWWVVPETERWQHEPWGATSDWAESRRAELEGVGELVQWRLAPVGRVGTE